MTNNMQRDFTNREELLAYLREQFPEAVERDNHISKIVGGRKAAEKVCKK